MLDDFFDGSKTVEDRFSQYWENIPTGGDEMDRVRQHVTALGLQEAEEDRGQVDDSMGGGLSELLVLEELLEAELSSHQRVSSTSL
jgi:hypothetical protein